MRVNKIKFITIIYIIILIAVDLDVSKICAKKQRGILHRFNVQHVRTLETATTAAVNLKYWEDAESYAKELEPGYL